MKQLTILCSAIVTLLFASGCYSVSHFQSESAEILDGGYFTDYQFIIIFDRLEMQQTASAEYAFSNAPSREFGARLVFESKDDLEVLIAHSAIAELSIERDSGEAVYEFAGHLSSDFSENKPLDSPLGSQWNFYTFGGFNPPPDWQWNPNRATVSPSTSAFRLDHGPYRVKLRLTTERPLPRAVGVYLSLQGFGGGTI